MASAFPQPDPHALEASRLLSDRLRRRIADAGGWIGFEEYMAKALYEPGLGYYSGGSVKIGPSGDFVTAPELGDLFAQVLARQVRSLLTPLPAPTIVELGAGTGRLARDLIGSLLQAGIAPDYRILEPSAELRARQQALLEGAGLTARVRWLETWSESPLEAVVLANEVLDALPVSRFVKRSGRVYPMGVSVGEGGAFVWAKGPHQPQLEAAVRSLEQKLGRELEEGFQSEICLGLPGWLATIAEPLTRGSMLLIDYGMVRREYYAPDRSSGTLRCHYRHRAHDDPFLYPGLQDITAWVDFSACADAALAAGLDVAGFTTQGQFLVEGGAAELLVADDTREAIERAQALKTLVLPGEMGERFKVMLLSRHAEAAALPGRDFRDRL